MGLEEITARVKNIKKRLQNGNAFGEPVRLVAATKTQSVERINAAIEGGVDAVAENKAQELRDKTGLLPCSKHFIGHLQSNKLKYVVGEVELIHSCDRDALAEEIAKLSLKKGLCSSVLLQVNISEEESKGGYPFEEAKFALKRLKGYEGIKVEGLMAMLPETDDLALLKRLAKKMRDLFEEARERDETIRFLSMGMSGDYELCIEQGSNMIRLGSTLFGQREYQKGRV